MTQLKSAEARAASLACWSGPVEPEPVAGGITNTNFLVRDRGERFFVRIGEDIPVHGVLRFNEVSATRAAAAAGIAPALIHSEPGALVSRFIEGRTLSAEDVRAPAMLERIVPLLGRCHRDIPGVLRGAIPMFWVFHVVRDYAASLREDGSRYEPQLTGLLARADALEAAVGPIDVVFGHNDLLAANFIDDGERLWLVDWEYAGFNSPLFDLGGLASNSELTSEQEDWLLERYFERPADAACKRRYRAMKCASLLRESMWSMVSEIHSELDVDYGAYTQENLTRFERAYTDLLDES
ncbi:MAG: phosphotransferase family protein [Bryobacterales bacterium]|nr:phosphotransferase family protein [Bryobacterales bacterium]